MSKALLLGIIFLFVGVFFLSLPFLSSNPIKSPEMALGMLMCMGIGWLFISIAGLIFSLSLLVGCGIID